MLHYNRHNKIKNTEKVEKVDNQKNVSYTASLSRRIEIPFLTYLTVLCIYIVPAIISKCSTNKQKKVKIVFPCKLDLCNVELMNGS